MRSPVCCADTHTDHDVSRTVRCEYSSGFKTMILKGCRLWVRDRGGPVLELCDVQLCVYIRWRHGGKQGAVPACRAIADQWDQKRYYAIE